MSGETFAAKLKRLREAADLTQAQLAERAGMNPFGIAKLEQGTREPTWATVQALADALGVSCEVLRTTGAQRATEAAPEPSKGKKGKGAGQAGKKRKGKG
jgi:transcriptional regulator with XRE-family HTH domain